MCRLKTPTLLNDGSAQITSRLWHNRNDSPSLFLTPHAYSAQ